MKERFYIVILSPNDTVMDSFGFDTFPSNVSIEAILSQFGWGYTAKIDKRYELSES